MDEKTKSGIVLPSKEGVNKFALYMILKASDESEYKFEAGNTVMCQQDYENAVIFDGKMLYMLDGAYFIALIGG